MEIVKLKVINFEKYNPRKDLKSINWFRVQSGIGTSQSLFDLPAEGKWLWIFILCECAKALCDTVTLRIRYVNSMTGITTKNILLYIDAMKENQLLEILTPIRNEDVTNTNENVPNERTNVHTNKHTCAFDFDLVWNEYPKKLGKKQAEKHFNSSVVTEKDFQDIKMSLNNYKKHIDGKEEKYIQHGSTWFNNWRDWMDYKPLTQKTKLISSLLGGQNV